MRWPEAIADQAELADQINRLRWWIDKDDNQEMLERVRKTLRWYNQTDFKGRYKTNAIVFYEIAKEILIQSIYDKSKGKRQSRTNRNLVGRA